MSYNLWDVELINEKAEYEFFFHGIAWNFCLFFDDKEILQPSYFGSWLTE